ncbi:MAG: hypothetical protein AAFQ57_01510 [Cyanobacteria bacterium J06626_14]
MPLFTAIIPFRTVGFFCLILAIGPVPVVYLGLGLQSALFTTVFALLGASFFIIPPSVANGARSSKGLVNAIAMTRSIVIFGIFGFVVSGYFGGSEFGMRLIQSVRSFRVGQWWQGVLLITVIVLVVDLISGLLQAWVAKISQS